MKQFIILGISALMASSALAEDVTVHGTIRDAYTKEPLAGVYVQAFLDAKYSAMTDSLGEYTLKLPDYVKSLRVKRAGYNMQQIPLANRTDEVDALLYTTAYTDGIGLATSSEQAVSVKVTDLTSDVAVDNQIGASLGGQIRSVNRGGVPGMGAFMLLNGINSLNANTQPLVVLDGVILDMQYDRTALHDGFYNNLLANVSIDDIESVSVLRNGTALYGSKGANGVILIETKRSHSYDTKIDVNISTRIEQTPNLPDLMNASEYRTYVSEMLGSSESKLRDFKFLREDPNYYYYKVYHNNTDWTKLVYDEAFSQNYSINVQGGDDVADYDISVGYAHADATLKKNDFTRFNLRLNSDIRVTDRVKIALNLSYSDVNRTMRDDGAPDNIDQTPITAPGFLSLVKSPFLSPYQYDNQGNLSNFIADADDYLDKILGGEQEKTLGSLSNPLSLLSNGEAFNKNAFGNRMVSLSFAPQIKLKHNLVLDDMFSFVLFNTDERYFTPYFGSAKYKLTGLSDELINKKGSVNAHEYLAANDLRLSWKLNKDFHRLNVSAGWRYRMSRYHLTSMTGYNAENDKLPEMTGDLKYKQTPGIDEKVTTLTYYMQGAYSLYEKYFLDATLSLEANTRFGADAPKAIQMFDVPWALFASASGSWVVTNEDWMPMTPWLNYLRLNVGFDLAGNDDVDMNASRTYMKAVRVSSFRDGIVAGGIGNTEVKWESTKRIVYGADANLLNNRLSLSVNAFKSWTSDLLCLQQLPYVIGLDENWGNGGKLENVGFDVTALAKVYNSRDWKCQVGLSVGHYKNEVTELPNGTIYTDIYNARIATKVGQPVGLFYGYKTDGVFATTAEAEAAGLYITDRTGARTYFQAGDMRFVDQDNNHEINDADRVVLGDPNPTIYGNITSHVQWKNLALDVAFNYSLGNDVYNYQRALLESGSRYYNQTTAMRGRWSSEGQKTDIPRLTYGDPMGNARFSDRWIEDGSYLRLKNVTLSYKWDFNYRFLQGLTVWGSAQNLFTLTKYLGSDPEFSASNNVLYQGIDRGLLPTSRNFSVGLKINL